MTRTESVVPEAGAEEGKASVRTAMELASSPERVWEALRLFEQIKDTPPLLLRLLLPEPLRVDSHERKVGSEVRCVYRTGFVLKRVTQSEAGRVYAFDVIDQQLPLAGGIRLLRGSFTLKPLAGGRTELALETQYTSPLWPRALWRPFEAAVCRAFHRHILDDLRRSL